QPAGSGRQQHRPQHGSTKPRRGPELRDPFGRGLLRRRLGGPQLSVRPEHTRQRCFREYGRLPAQADGFLAGQAQTPPWREKSSAPATDSVYYRISRLPKSRSIALLHREAHMSLLRSLCPLAFFSSVALALADKGVFVSSASGFGQDSPIPLRPLKDIPLPE